MLWLKWRVALSRARDASWKILWKLLKRSRILPKYLKALRFLSAYFLNRRTSVDWKLSIEQRRQLRLMIDSPGWKIYTEKLKQVETETHEYLLAVNEPAELLRRKGMVDGLRQIVSLAETLYSVAEEGEEQWLENQVNRRLQGLEELLRQDPELLQLLEERL